MRHFVVIDAGTQNVKAFLFDEKGNEVHGEAYPVSPYFATQPDFAEQDAEEYLRITQKVTRSVVENSHVPKTSSLLLLSQPTEARSCPLIKMANLFAPQSPGLTSAKQRGSSSPADPFYHWRSEYQEWHRS